MGRSITSFSCLTLDCYGTLVDWEAGIFHALQPLNRRLPRAHPLRDDRPSLLRAFSRHEGAVQAEQPTLPYRHVLSCAYGRLAAELGLTLHPHPHPHPDAVGEEEMSMFGRSVGDWPVFPDTVAAMKRLHRHFQLIVLSNVDRESFAATRLRLKDAPLDGTCLAEDIGSYKPSLNNFEHLVQFCEGRGIRKEDILHTAQSLKHDHEPAMRMGLASAWIERGAGDANKGEGEGEAGCESVMGGEEAAFEGKVEILWRFRSLGEMADFVEAEAARLASQ